MVAPKDLTGKVFGRLTVLRLDPKKHRRSWMCICSCGNEKTAAQADLRDGSTASCGCLRKESSAEKARAGKVDHSKLDASAKTAYRKWALMWNRVRNPKGKSECYAGIGVTEDWKNFYKFYSDMGAPQLGWSLDRIDSAKDYSAENCRWVPLAKQAQNTRRNRIVEFEGVTACVSEHARRFGIDPDVVFDRMNKLGWSADKALRTPKRAQRKAKGNKPTELQKINLNKIEGVGGIALVIDESNVDNVGLYLKGMTYEE